MLKGCMLGKRFCFLCFHTEELMQTLQHCKILPVYVDRIFFCILQNIYNTKLHLCLFTLHVGITITHFTGLSFRLLNCLLSLLIIRRLIYSGSTKGLKRK